MARELPLDADFLDVLWRERFAHDGSHAYCPKCDSERKFHRVRDRPTYDCDSCGHHIHPTAGTIFHKSTTSLRVWFRAIRLIADSRDEMTVKRLKQEVGVTYKTAWRMSHLIRDELMTQDDDRHSVEGAV